MKLSEMAEKLCIICCKLTVDSSRKTTISSLPEENSSYDDHLERELSATFLLRKVIEVPPDVCAQLLEEYGQFSTWLFLCEVCKVFVAQARSLFDEMAILQKRFNSLQREIKGEIMYSEVYQLNLTLATIPGMTLETEAMKKVRSQVNYSQDDFKCMQNGRVALKRLGETSLPVNEDCQDTANAIVDAVINADNNGSIDAVATNSTDLHYGTGEQLKESNFLFETIKVEAEDIEKNNSSDCDDPDYKFNDRHSKRGVSTSKQNNSLPRNFVCDVCQKAFSARHHLTRHLMIHKDKPFMCEICKSCFLTPEDLNVHNLRSHREKWEISLQRKGDDGNVEKLIASASTMYPHRCAFCGKGYSRSDHLRYHERSHTNERPFACEICGHSFKIKDSLIHHQLRTHSGERPYKCDDCGVRFAIGGNLQQHRKRVHGVIPPPRVKPIHRCNFCGHIFEKPNILETHIRKHTGERPFVCGICKKGFTSNTLLKNHTIVHNAEKPYKCDICEKTFLNNRDMNYHKLINHKN